jgi:hypothetical protein
MDKKIVLSFIGFSLLTNTLFGAVVAKNTGEANSFRHMLKDGKVTGEIRSMYIGYDEKNSNNQDATAIGGMLKYELANFNGFGGGVVFRTSNDITVLSGEGEKHNSELSGDRGSYNQLSQAYISYKNDKFTFKGGRQGLDTPLADSDDIRMIPNSFNAYVLAYKADSYELSGGYFDRWQGVDAGLDNEWVKTGKNGTAFVGIGYDGKIYEANGWVYAFSNASESAIANGADANGNDSYYVDFGAHYHINKDIKIHGVAQYLKQNERDKSGISSEIYGVSAEVVVKDLTFNVAYNDAKRQAAKHSFSGYGGGSLFTSLDAMIVDEITEDRRAYAWVGSCSYAMGEMSFLYAYGEFKGDADSAGQKADIVEQNIAFEYTHAKEWTLSAIYVIDRNKEDSSSEDFNNDNFRVLIAYNF